MKKLLVASGIVVCSWSSCHGRIESADAKYEGTLDGKSKFKDCNEFKAYMEHLTASEKGEIVADIAPPSQPTQSEFNSQETNIQEGDQVQMSAQHIFVARHRDVRVIDRATGQDIGAIALPTSDQMPTWNVPQIFVAGQHLFVLSENQSFATRVSIYRLNSGQLPSLVRSEDFSGYAAQAMMTQNKLILRVQNWLPHPYVAADGIHVAGVPHLRCDEVVTPLNDRDRGHTMSTLYALDLLDIQATIQTIAFLGESGPVYTTAESTYMTKTDCLRPEGIPADAVSFVPEHCDTVITQVAHPTQDQTFQLLATGRITGTIKNRWALKESQDGKYLFASTTINTYPTTNSIYTLAREGDQLEVKATLADITPDEVIQGIRYVGSTAFLVTFKQTDPLFAIDLSEPLAPKILGELKVPGFSSQLYPLANKKLLGIGFETEDDHGFARRMGIQVSLFDVSDLSTPARLDVLTHGTRGSLSTAAFDSHAAFYDEDANLVAWPYDASSASSQDSDGNIVYPMSNGARFYSIANNRFDLVKDVSHHALLPEDCQNAANSWTQHQFRPTFNIERIVKVDQNIYTLSPFGYQIFSSDLSQMQQETVFPNADVTCKDLLLRVQDVWSND